MAEPMKQRTMLRRIAVVTGVVLAVLLVDVMSSGPHPAVLTLVLGLVAAGLALGTWQAGRTVLGDYVSTESRRRANAGLVVGIVVAVDVVLGRMFDVERSTFQDVLAVTGVAVTAFLLALSLTLLRSLRAEPSVSDA